MMRCRYRSRVYPRSALVRRASRVNPTCVDRYKHRAWNVPDQRSTAPQVLRAAPHPGHTEQSAALAQGIEAVLDRCACNAANGAREQGWRHGEAEYPGGLGADVATY